LATEGLRADCSARASNKTNSRSNDDMTSAGVTQTMKLAERQREVYCRYAELALPRHTSYPAVPFWRDYGPRPSTPDAWPLVAA
jgi:hypothetical protein